MAHFAEIDETNTVIRILVVPDEEEHRGQEFLAADLDLGGTWIQTSYNTINGVHLLDGTPLRLNFAGIGMTYDSERDVFHHPQPFPSFTLDDDGFWQAPVSKPDEGRHTWDEESLSWVVDDLPPTSPEIANDEE